MAVESEEAMQDSVSFLEQLQAEYRNATALLSPKQLKALDISPTVAFDKETVNEDFARLAEEYFSLKSSGDNTYQSLRMRLIDAHPASKAPDVEEHRKVTAVLKKVAERLLKIWHMKLRATEEARGEDGLPRIIRLNRRLKLSEKEGLAMVYILSCQIGDMDRTRGLFRGAFGGTGSGTLDVCRMCDMKISEIVDFLGQDRIHMQQGMFPDVQQSYLLHSALSFDEVSIKALVGAPLTSSEFLKLETTHLADVIAEERGNEHFREGAMATSPTIATMPAEMGTEEGKPSLKDLLPPGMTLEDMPPEMRMVS